MLVDHDDIDLIAEHASYVLDCRYVVNGSAIDKL
jgi:hypothetical protein